MVCFTSLEKDERNIFAKSIFKGDDDPKRTGETDMF